MFFRFSLCCSTGNLSAKLYKIRCRTFCITSLIATYLATLVPKGQRFHQEQTSSCLVEDSMRGVEAKEALLYVKRRSLIQILPRSMRADELASTAAHLAALARERERFQQEQYGEMWPIVYSKVKHLAEEARAWLHETGPRKVGNGARQLWNTCSISGRFACKDWSHVFEIGIAVEPLLIDDKTA